MPVVTALRPDPRAEGCLVVEVDDTRVASLPVEVVQGLGLARGQELAPSLSDAIVTAARVEATRRVAVRLLAARPYATSDLFRKLRDRGHDPDAISSTVQRLQSSGLLNDADFARHFARVRGARGHGPSRLIHDLMGRGVSRSVAEQAVAEVNEQEGTDLNDQVRKLAERRASRVLGLPPDRAEKRLLMYLHRRGFRGREVRKLVVEVLEAARPQAEGSVSRG